MPDLDEQIRELIDGGSTPVKLEEISGLRSHRARYPVARALVVVVVVMAAIAVPILTVRSPHRPQQPRRERAVSPALSWRLAGYISQPAWQIQPGFASDPYRISCPTSTTCYASGPSAPPASTPTSKPPPSVVEVTHDGASTWQRSLAPVGAISLDGISCPAADTCMSIGFTVGPSGEYSMFTTTDGGMTWSALPIPGSSTGGGLLSCSSASNCVAMYSTPGPGGQGIQYVSLTTSDGGRDWAAASIPGTFRPDVLDCFVGGRCIAGGYEPDSYRMTTGEAAPAALIYSSDGGASWVSASLPSGGSSIDAVSCSDTEHCMAVESGPAAAPTTSMILVTENGGETWAPTNVPAGLSLIAVSCPATLDCWASGSSSGLGGTNSRGVILSTRDGGSSWTSEQVPTTEGTTLPGVTSITCPNVSRCFALANRPSSSVLPSGQLVLSNAPR
jgi:photosystem II stability/assembly factor-like uncharacterized protein